MLQEIEKKSILVVEDEAPLLEAIRLKLSSKGYKVFTAVSVKVAINHLKKDRDISAIWLDHYLSGDGRNGLDLMEYIRKKDIHWVKTPVFVVSNTASDDKIKMYSNFNINKFFIKSDVSLSNIIEAVNCSLSPNC